MAQDNKQFIVDINKFVSKSNVSVNTVRAFMAYELFSRVIDRTPVGFSFEKHSGTAKFNWKCTIGAMSSSILKGTDKNGAKTKARMLAVLERVTGDQSIFFANSLPYIWSLEEGLYPSPVSKGSWNKQTKDWEIRSAGGFSKRAPSGMVKLTLTEVPTIRAQALRKAKALNA